MSSSPACSNYNLHLSNENDVIAATPTPLEQEKDPLSSIIDTELVTFANSCNDADFNDFLNNFVQVQETESESNVSCKLRHVSHSHHLRDGLWSAVIPPSTASKTDGNGNDNDDDDETTSTPTPTDTPDYTDTEKESKTAVTLKFDVDENIGIGSDENMYRDFDEDVDEEAMAKYGESENENVKFDENIGMGSDENMFFDEDEEAMAHEKLYSTNTMNTKWDDNWQQKFSELQSFKQQNGHINVSTPNENTRSLGFWLDRQKQFVRQYESTSTTNEVESYKRRHRYDLLLSVGLTNLGAHDKAWETTFGELLAYRSEHHTCNVPTKGTNLGRWVSKMRKQYKTYHLYNKKPDGWNDKMERRYLRLKEAGFVFCAAEKRITSERDKL